MLDDHVWTLSEISVTALTQILPLINIQLVPATNTIESIQLQIHYLLPLTCLYHQSFNDLAFKLIGFLGTVCILSFISAAASIWEPNLDTENHSVIDSSSCGFNPYCFLDKCIKGITDTMMHFISGLGNNETCSLLVGLFFLRSIYGPTFYYHDLSIIWPYSTCTAGSGREGCIFLQTFRFRQLSMILNSWLSQLARALQAVKEQSRIPPIVAVCRNSARRRNWSSLFL